MIANVIHAIEAKLAFINAYEERQKELESRISKIEKGYQGALTNFSAVKNAMETARTIEKSTRANEEKIIPEDKKVEQPVVEERKKEEMKEKDPAANANPVKPIEKPAKKIYTEKVVKRKEVIEEKSKKSLNKEVEEKKEKVEEKPAKVE